MNNAEYRALLKTFTEWSEDNIDLSKMSDRIIVRNFVFGDYATHQSAFNEIRERYEKQMPYVSDTILIITRISLKKLLNQFDDNV